jgi:hypothetical protein
MLIHNDIHIDPKHTNKLFRFRRISEEVDYFMAKE